MSARGYFEIGVYHPKTRTNVGTLWRSAFQLGAAGVFVIGRRYKKQASDTVKTPRHIPLREYDSFDLWRATRPHGALLVGIEMGGELLEGFVHPPQAVYLLGAEDHGLPEQVLEQCDRIVSLSSVRTDSYNVAIAGALVMYHRCFGRGGQVDD
jgi:tRNA G18 (ribose-2'-O)-methylase SpoU